MREAKTPPRDTSEIKAKLRSYGELQRRIDLLITRLENHMETIDTLPTPNYSGMPSGSHDGTTKAERYVERKDELEQKIDRMIQQEKELRKEVEDMIALLSDPDEQTALEMRYIDGLNWWEVTVALWGSCEDYDEHEKRYLKRTFRIHGEALQRLAAVFQPKTSPAEQ